MCDAGGDAQDHSTCSTCSGNNPVPLASYNNAHQLSTPPVNNSPTTLTTLRKCKQKLEKYRCCGTDNNKQKSFSFPVKNILKINIILFVYRDPRCFSTKISRVTPALTLLKPNRFYIVNPTRKSKQAQNARGKSRPCIDESSSSTHVSAKK